MNQKITALTTDAEFQASDDEILKVEAAYCQFESGYVERLKNVRQEYPGCHDYFVKSDKIVHDPYVLACICSAVKPDFRAEDQEIKDLLEDLQSQSRQYTWIVSKQIAPEFENDIDTKDIDSIDPGKVDLYIKLTNYDLDRTIDSVLTEDQIKAYAGYLRNLGGRPDLFADSPNRVNTTKYKYLKWQPLKKDLDEYPLFREQMRIAKDLLGEPYVWNGFSKETSFDCSGLICYILDRLGFRYRNNIRGKEVRLAVAGSTVDGQFYDGLYEKCHRIEYGEEQPGDLVFFTGTFNASYRPSNLSHVGIYCGDGVFLASSNSVGVAFVKVDCVDRDYFSYNPRDRLVCFGRLKDYNQG